MKKRSIRQRDRVLMALRHVQPDRTPVDLWAEPQVWERLLKDLRLSSREEVLDFLDIDIRYLEPVYPEDTFTNGIRQNMWGERWAKTETAFGAVWDHIDGVLSKADSLEELRSFPWPNCDQVDYSTILPPAWIF